MELLYLIDLWVTRFLQALGRFVESRSKIDKEGQLVVLLIVLMFTWATTLPLRLLGVEVGTYPRILAFPVALSVLISIPVLSYGTTLLLRELHKFLDERGFKKTDKLYSDGHFAWAQLLAGLGLAIGGYFLYNYPVVCSYLFTTSGLLLPMAYYGFNIRGAGQKNRDKKGMTEALRKLLERCSSWLPKPASIPS